jgi:hypothetical protein
MAQKKSNNFFGDNDPFGLNDLFKPLADAFTEGTEMMQLSWNCKMRRFYLVRDEDVDLDKVSGTGVIASGVVFEDGFTFMRWTKEGTWGGYQNIEQLLRIHGHGGKTKLKYVDAEALTL